MARTEDHGRSHLARACALIAVVAATSCRRQPTRPILGGGVPRTEVSSNRFEGTPQAHWPDDSVRAAVQGAERAELGSGAAGKVHVSVEHGVVLLSGTVDTLLTRRASVAAAESVRGVRSVVDEMSVQVARRPDAAIAKDVRRALSTRAPGRTGRVDARVSGGVVTLSGVVASGPELDLAVEAAAGVPGVSAVRTEVTVRAGPNRPDREIMEDVRDRLRWALPLDATRLTVTSANGDVILSGQVATPQDRLRAMHLGWVAGVHHVNADAVVVEPSAFPREPLPPVVPAATDAAIAKAVKDAIFYDPRVRAADVGVDAHQAIVTLRGQPRTAFEARAALEDAKATVGVKQVADLMEVRPASAVPDAQLERNVLQALAGDPLSDLHNLSVRVIDGVAMLRGEVSGQLAHSRAVEIASAVPGIRSVGDGIVIGQQPSRHGALRAPPSRPAPLANVRLAAHATRGSAPRR